MSEQKAAQVQEDWRDRVLSDPGMILEDRDVMRALVAARDAQAGNVVDLRGLAMERLEARLERLEDTHRSVIAAAYENLAGTNQVHRCVLRLLACDTFDAMLDLLRGDMAAILRVDEIRLCLEATAPAASPHAAVSVVPQGFVSGYVAPGRHEQARQVTLRRCAPAAPEVFGEAAGAIRSEALLRLELGTGRLGAMLAFGSEDPHRFCASQGTELTTFLACVFETLVRRHLD
jgi:uncharacterized protein YigA (DUF484 family)